MATCKSYLTSIKEMEFICFPSCIPGIMFWVMRSDYEHISCLQQALKMTKEGK